MEKRKIAFYGNNLNQGYFFVRNLSRIGLQAKLFCIDYPYLQEHHHWWTDQAMKSNLVCFLKTGGYPLGTRRDLRTIPGIRKLYKAIKEYDVIIMMEDGPALFSELEGVKKIFVSAGADLQLLPFLIDIYYRPKKVLTEFVKNFRVLSQGDIKNSIQGIYNYLRGAISSAHFQGRQRKGLRQCSAMICSPHQDELIDQLGLDRNKVHHLTFPMDTTILAEVDDSDVVLQNKYDKMDLVFFHPTRQFYLKENNDRFLKDNDKLIYAYAHFLNKTCLQTKLILVLKGREKDISHSQELIRKMRLEDHVEWLPEMPNKQLRAFYKLPQLVVCDQFNPHLAILGNIGREASFYGRLIITAFAAWNRVYFGEDMPPHVLPGQTEDEIVGAMLRVGSMNRAEKERLSQEAVRWFSRNLDSNQLMPKFMDLIMNV